MNSDDILEIYNQRIGKGEIHPDPDQYAVAEVLHSLNGELISAEEVSSGMGAILKSILKGSKAIPRPVSYTHLTLPTILRV